MKGELSTWIEQAAGLESSGAAARSTGNERAADAHFRGAFDLAVKAVNCAAETRSHPDRLEVLHLAVRLALNCGEVAEARRLMEEAFAADTSVASLEGWQQFRDVTSWPDAWLVAAVRRDPPDDPALEALAQRHWKPLFGRCYLLTLDHNKASDLAQQAWCRVLRARQRLKPSGNFPAYLAAIATNLWRDSHRSSRRAGPLSEDRLASLDQALSLDDGDDAVLGDVLPDLNSLNAEEKTLLKLDIDRGLQRLTPHLRDVLVARFITGESCAEIGLRYGRTEQSVSGWVREAIREMKLQLEEPAPVARRTKEP
jgi:RNA polymerase sigma-70 factor (ECF subfamily)